MKSETLSLETIINELDFLKKTVITQWKIRKKDLYLFAIKLAEKIRDLCNNKKPYQSFIRKKIANSGKAIENNHSATKNFWKPKHRWYKISYYRTSKKFT